jgi:two-component system sensor histidine kinase BaeS
MSLRRQILWSTLAVGLIMLLVGLVGATAIQRAIRDGQRREIARQGEATAGLVEAAIDARPLRSRLAIADVLEVVGSVGGHDYVEAALRTNNGSISLLGDAGTLFGALPNAVGDGVVTEVFIEGETVLTTVVAVDAGERGTILIAIGRTESLVIGTTVSRTILIALGVGAVVAVLLAFGLSATLGRRLDGLSRAARSYAAGDFTVRLDEEGDTEVAAVAAAFNEMADELAAGRMRERDFLLSVGHDLRTPLTTIRGYAEGLASGDVPREDLPRVAAVLESQANRLSRLVEDLMMLARLEAREFTLAPEPVVLAAHMEGVVESYSTRSKELGVRMDARIDDVGVVVLDPDRITQIAANLIDNALRYTPEQGTVTVTLERRGGEVELAVVDTGPGIDELDLPRVFERLYVAQKYRPVRPEGSGLGLSIVKALADAMGASVEVTSALGAGTTVQARFPDSTRSAEA